jgi:hypothetical protein
MNGLVVLAVTVACGVAFWRFLVWASGLDARAAEQAAIDAEFAEIVERLR